MQSNPNHHFSIKISLAKNNFMQKIKFSKIDKKQFFSTLRSRVNEYFESEDITTTGTYRIYLKALIMLTLYLLPLVLMWTGVVGGWYTILLYAVMGIGTAGIGLGVMHDANHGSFSKYKIVNDIVSYSMNLIGGSSFTWKMQHNIMHHSFTNVYELDEDVDDKPFLRLSPHGKKKRYHKFQHIYALFLYGLATFSWILFKDLKQLWKYNQTGMTEKYGYKPVKETIIMLTTKLLYVAILVVLPAIFITKWYIILLGFLLLHLIAGFSITVVFQLAHVVEGPEHFTVKEDPKLENTWAIHQISTTANFSTKNKVLTWLVGGLNFQIEHHLFPHISHIHYPKISKIVKSTVKEFDLPYYEFKNMGSALGSHLRMLRQFGVA